MVDDAILQRVHEFRIAARHAVEAVDSGDRAQLLALLDLADLARREPDLITRTWSERAIWEEAEPFLLREEPAVVGDAWEQAQRQLRAEGRAICPRCRSSVASENELERMQQQRLDRIEEYERKLNAVDRG